MVKKQTPEKETVTFPELPPVPRDNVNDMTHAQLIESYVELRLFCGQVLMKMRDFVNGQVLETALNKRIATLEMEVETLKTSLKNHKERPNNEQPKNVSN